MSDSRSAAARRAALALAAGLAGCTLDPLVDDAPGASVHVLPSGAEVPRVDEDLELVHQIAVNDGLDDGDLEDSGGVVARETGWAGGAEVRYWPFGSAPLTGALVYVLGEETAAGFRPLDDHPWLLDTLPGDPAYSAMRRIQHVAVTDAYRGERLPTVRALTDAIELGLVAEPVATGTWIDAPVVPPGVVLEVDDGATRGPTREAYGAGVRVDVFVFGDERGIQPLRNGAIPLGQAAQLREAGTVRLLAAPVFQWAVPAEAPGEDFNWTPLVAMVEVDLAPGVVAAEQIHADVDLFTRDMRGGISGYTEAVADYAVTTTIRNWPSQFVEGDL